MTRPAAATVAANRGSKARRVPVRGRAAARTATRARLLLGVLVAGALASCSSGTRPLDDDERIIDGVLTLLAAENRPVCVDDRTEKHALDIYREMILAPLPSRRILRWYPPRPLRPDIRVTGRDLRQSELGDRQIEIEEPGARPSPLAGLDQLYYNNAAHRLMQPETGSETEVAIAKSWTPPMVTGRWWPINRLRKDCWPLFVLSNPVRGKDIAFVTVRAEHWGTLYALKPANGRWTPVAEWSRWLY